MRDDTLLKEAMDLSRPFPWERSDRIVIVVAVAVVVLCGLGLWKLAALIVS